MSEDTKVKQNPQSGLAPVKNEFLDSNYKPKLVVDYLPETTVNELRDLINDQSSSEPAKKRPKLTGRNKKRPVEKRPKPSERLCPAIAKNEICSYGDRCKFNHDVAKFMQSHKSSMSDIGCYVFETYGRCPYGLACQFAACHTDESMKTIVNNDLVEKFCNRTFVTNVLSKNLQIQLRKKEYDYSRADMALKNEKTEWKSKLSQKKVADAVPSDVSSERVLPPESSGPEIENGNACVDEPNKTNVVVAAAADVETIEDGCTSKTADRDHTGVNSAGENSCMVSKDMEFDGCLAETCENNISTCGHTDTSVVVADVTVKSSGCLTDEDVIKLRPCEKKKIDFRGKLYLAPLTTVGNLPFRRICKRLGADITCGEMAMATNLLQGQQSEWALLKRHETETIFGAQLCGSYADTMTRTVQVITENTDVDFVDINVGCPIDLVVQKGEGCALMGRVGRFEQIIKCLKSVTDLPLTVKMRTGLQENHNTAHTLLPMLAKLGVSMTTIHGRSREQRYTKLADWSYIRQCVDAAKPMPVFGNGDIMSYTDYQRSLEMSGVAGCMLARGALIKPWVFTEIKEQRDWDISATERFEIVKEFTNYGLEHWGSDKQGIANTRKFLLEWLSFTHRYIPVGLLERVPQRINERPPRYFGRNDMETLLASANCADWIKLSEMLLGPVPDDFSFLPKHRANSYQ